MLPDIMRALASKSLAPLLLATLLGTAACSSSEPQTESCDDAFKCDIPDGPDEELCVERRLDVFNENQYGFLENNLRWSCADVSGVTANDRGQEYCEYFAMVQLPTDEPGTSAAVLGKNLGATYEAGTTEERLDLTFDELVALESDEDAIVGQCVFTSWNSDVDDFEEACWDPEDELCTHIMGYPLTEDIFRMTFENNSADAAQVLVEDCMQDPPKAGDFANALDPRHDDFFRACMFNGEINQTAYRKSDSTVCASAVRLAECGCAPVDPDLVLSEYISPFERLGFPLGTWSSEFELPAICRYVDESRRDATLVTCDLSAAEVIRGANDLKGYCMQKYADNVVVHVPLPPADQIACDPTTSNSPYAATCGDMPWIVEPTKPADRSQTSDY